MESFTKITRKTNTADNVLHIAVRKNDTEMLQVLLQQNAEKVDERNKGLTPLHLAARYYYTELVRVLLQHDADAYKSFRTKFSALHIAAKNCHVDVIERLIERGADINTTVTTDDDNSFGCSQWSESCFRIFININIRCTSFKDR